MRWPEYRSLAVAAEQSGFDSIWLGDHLLYRGDEPARARAVGGLDDAGRAGCGDRAGHAGTAGRVRGIPPTGGAGQDGGDDRRDQRRPLRPGRRRRLEPQRVRCLRHPVRSSRRPVRRGLLESSNRSSPAGVSRVHGEFVDVDDSRAAPAAAPTGPADGGQQRPARARDHAAHRRHLEHVVQRVRQPRRRLRPTQRRRHPHRRSRWDAIRRPSNAARACW